MPQAARITDMHSCPQITPGQPPILHIGGAILPPGMSTVLINGIAAARLGDKAVCVGSLDSIATGSATVLIGGMPAARLGDKTAHGGQIITGAVNVIIGG